MTDRPDLTDRAQNRIVHCHRITVVHDLRMSQALGTGDRHLERNVGAGLQPRQPVVEVVPAKGLLQLVFPFLRVLRSREGRQAGEPRILEHVAETAAPYGVESETICDLLSRLGYTIFSVTGAGPFTRSDFAAERAVVNWLAVAQDR